MWEENKREKQLNFIGVKNVTYLTLPSPTLTPLSVPLFLGCCVSIITAIHRSQKNESKNGGWYWNVDLNYEPHHEYGSNAHQWGLPIPIVFWINPKR